MKFTVEVVFVGVGLVVIHEKRRSRRVASVDLWLIDTSKQTMATQSMPRHLPRLTFRLGDLADTKEDPFKTPHVGADGLPMIELPLEGKDLTLTTKGGGRGPFEVTRITRLSATGPGAGAPQKAINWVPDIVKDVGIDDAVVPDHLTGSRYIAHVRLPAGCISSRNLLLNTDGTTGMFSFGSDPAHALAEQFVWTRHDVSRVAIDFGKGLSLDAETEIQRHQRPVVQIAVSNLPEIATPGRHPTPDHIAMFKLVSEQGKKPKPLKRVGGTSVTMGGACPPARMEVVS